jgi:hypothetical protein
MLRAPLRGDDERVVLGAHVASVKQKFTRRADRQRRTSMPGFELGRLAGS